MPPTERETSMIPDLIRRSFIAAVAIPLAVTGVRKLSGVRGAQRGPRPGAHTFFYGT
jgi:hypothetical protein